MSDRTIYGFDLDTMEMELREAYGAEYVNELACAASGHFQSSRLPVGARRLTDSELELWIDWDNSMEAI